MENRLAGLPPPDINSAVQVEQALHVLHSGDSRITQADRFLSQVRSSPAAWPIVRAIFHQDNSTPAALSFAASTVYHRLTADWLLFPTDHDRLILFSLVIEGMQRLSHQSNSNSHSAHHDPAVHSLGKAAGFAISNVAHANTRIHMWQQLNNSFNNNPTFRCQTLASVAAEVNAVATTDCSSHNETRQFCRHHVTDVIRTPIEILVQLNSSSNGITSTLPQSCVQPSRAAILCAHAWQRYATETGQAIPLAHALLRAVRIPALAADAAETVAEFVAYTGTSLEVLVGVCDGLLAILHAAISDPPDEQEIVHHAVAEIVCALSDGNADELMEQSSAEAEVVVAKAADLLYLCLKSSNDRSFFAAADGWSNWLSAQTLVSEQCKKLPIARLKAIPPLVTARMTSLPFMQAIFVEGHDAEEEQQSGGERDCVMDLLLNIAACIGITEYVKSVLSIFESHQQQQHELSPQMTCAVLEALAAASEHSEDAVQGDPHAFHILHLMLGTVMQRYEALAPLGLAQMDDPSAIVVRRTALKCLSAYAHILAETSSLSSSDEEFYRAIRCSGTGILHDKQNKNAAELLCELAERTPKRLVPYLPQLVCSCKDNLHMMSPKAAEICVKALSRIASALPSTVERLHTINVVLQDIIKQLHWACDQKQSQQSAQVIEQHLIVLTTALHELNDGEAAIHIFELINSAVFKLASTYCANTAISTIICRLLMLCVAPTLTDDPDEETEEEGFTTSSPTPDDHRQNKSFDVGSTEHRRVTMAVSCYSLSAECFSRSTPDGEARWLDIMFDLLPYLHPSSVHTNMSSSGMTAGWNEMMKCLTAGMGHAVSGMDTFCGIDYDAQPGLTKAFLKHARAVLECCNSITGAGSADEAMPIMANIHGIGRICIRALQCVDQHIVREAVAFWGKVFTMGTEIDVNNHTAKGLLQVSGGPGQITQALLCATRSSRCADSVATALFAMSKMIVGREGDYEGLLRELLKESFEKGPMSQARMDTGMKERLQAECYNGVISLFAFRKALWQYGHAYRVAVVNCR